MNRLIVDILKRALLLPLLLASLNARSAQIEGQNFDDRIQLADSELVLNGLGLRARFWIKGYAAGLYLTAKAATAEQVIGTAGPKRIRLKMMLEVEAKEFVKAIDVGVRRNSSEAQLLALKDRLAQFEHNVALIGTVKKGDVINLDFIPEQGLVLMLNGKPRGEPIAGEDLYAGVLKIFVGELPVDKNLKAGLLGGASH